MDLDHFKLFKALGARMNWLQNRQRVLAENVANADTPGFKAKDLRPLTFKNTMMRMTVSMRLNTTHQAHIGITGEEMNVKVITERQNSQGNVTGNNVVLEEEMMKSAETAADYQLATSLYKKSVGLLRLAISRR
jgi:flagellar basal-body rod protein FlgB